MISLSHRDRRGFTLLELVVVIVILAILAGLAVPRYMRTVNRSRGQEALVILGHLREAAQRYYARNNGSYANMTIAQLDFDPTDVGGSANFTFALTAAAAASFTFTATRLATPGDTASAVAADTITINESGTVTGAGIFAGI